MLEYWYTDRRTLAEFRQGPLGPHFDGMAAWLKEKGYAFNTSQLILGISRRFNSHLIDQGVTQCKNITPNHGEGFLACYLADYRPTSKSYDRRRAGHNLLRVLFKYLEEMKIIKAAPPEQIPNQYDWVLSPYLQYLREECEYTEPTVKKARKFLSCFLASLGGNVTRRHLKTLPVEAVEAHAKQYLEKSPENLRLLAGSLRRFLRYCARKRLIRRDLSSAIPSIPAYRLAALPQGMNEQALQRILKIIPQNTVVGSRNYAILLLMMAYGLRGKSVVELLLEDLDWKQSTIRIHACKGGKEVVLPLLEAVGESILRYLHFRPKTSFRQVFLSVHAPIAPLSYLAISQMVHGKMIKAGVKTPKSGLRTFRHSWAIRALAHDSPMKSIADVLGHRSLDTTFIYAKADLKTLRQVAMPWPKGR